jgi:hypothetical protein
MSKPVPTLVTPCSVSFSVPQDMIEPPVSVADSASDTDTLAPTAPPTKRRCKTKVQVAQALAAVDEDTPVFKSDVIPEPKIKPRRVMTAEKLEALARARETKAAKRVAQKAADKVQYGKECVEMYVEQKKQEMPPPQEEKKPKKARKQKKVVVHAEVEEESEESVSETSDDVEEEEVEQPTQPKLKRQKTTSGTKKTRDIEEEEEDEEEQRTPFKRTPPQHQQYMYGSQSARHWGNILGLL